MGDGQIGRPRRESCGAAVGSDSPGIDCSSPPAAINVGYARDASVPSPLFVSLPDALAPAVKIQDCDKIGGQSIECGKPRKIPFELHTHVVTGERLCYRESSKVHLKMQKSSDFPTVNDALVPLMSQTEHFCMSGYFWFRYFQIKKLPRDYLDGVMGLVLALVHYSLWLCFSVRSATIWKQVDISTDDSDKCCI